MIPKFSLLTLCFFCLITSACYTITHPDPCPGLVEIDLCDDSEVSSNLNY